MFSIKNIKRAYTLAEVMIVMLIIAVVVSISIKLAKTKLEHITSYTYYSAFSVVRNVTAEMLNDFNAEDENYISHEGLLTRLFMPKTYADEFLGVINGENYWYKVVDACTIDATYPTYTFGSQALDEYAKNKISSTMKRVGEARDIERVRELLHTGDENVCIYYVSRNVCIYEEKVDASCTYINGEDGLRKGKYSYADLPAHFWCTRATWCAQTPQYGLVWVEDADPDPGPVPNPEPDPPSCEPRPCPGGNEFYMDICDCDCRKEPPPPEKIPCGKEWSDSQCQLVDKSDFPPVCPAGQVLDKRDGVCGCQPIKPSIPIKGANYCKLFVSYSNTSQLQTECAGDSVSSDTTEFAGLNPDIILRNGMRLYNVSQNPVKIPILTGNSKGNAYTYKNDANEDVTIDLDEYGYILYVDIDGERSGNGVLWEDVYPFYVTLSGMTVPAFKTGDVESYGGGNKLYLQVSLQDEYLNNSGRHIDWLLKSKPFRESACKSGYLSANSNYCKTSPAITTLAQCGLEDHDCRLKYVSPSKLFK